MNISKLMGNPAALAAFESGGGVPLTEVGDAYRLARARGDRDVALGIETYVRVVARVHPDLHQVRSARRTVELHLGDRAYGSSGTQPFKAIAEAIRVAWRDGEYTRIEGGERVEFRIGTLTLRCRNNSSAVEVLALKYTRGLKR